MVDKPKRKHVRTGRPRGRPKGDKANKGRPKGSPNKVASETRRRIIAEAEANGTELPLDYILRKMRDLEQPDSVRDDMAKAALPYLHSKAPQVTQLQGDANKPLVQEIKYTVEKAPDWDSAIEDADDTKPPVA